jgi:hypothetical protein
LAIALARGLKEESENVQSFDQAVREDQDGSL